MQSNEKRFNELYSQNRMALLQYFLRRMQDREQAADCLAQTFLTAWRRITDVPGGHDGRLWLFGVARRVHADVRRGNARYANLAQRVAQAIPSTFPPSLEDDRGATAITELLVTLSAEDREILLLNAWEGLSSTEIASVLGMNANTVRTRLFRARSTLKKSWKSAAETADSSEVQARSGTL